MTDERLAELLGLTVPQLNARHGFPCTCCGMRHGPSHQPSHTGNDHCDWCHPELNASAADKENDQ